MKKPETTSKEILAVAGRIRSKLRRAKKGKSATITLGFFEKQNAENVWVSIPNPFTVDELESCMQSLITQAADRPSDAACICHKDSNGTRKCPAHNSKKSARS